jgi:hypothetical protein
VSVLRPSTPQRWDRHSGGWLAGFAVSSAVGIYLSFHINGGLALLTIRWHLFEHLAVWFGVWVIGVFCALHLPRRPALVLILLVAVVLRCGALENAPRLSNDVNRYGWDARVQLAGIDPYRYPPRAKELRYLRETWTFPTRAGCIAMNHAFDCTILNRPNVRTIYPPLAEAWFTAVYWLGGGWHSQYKPFQLAGFATELGSMTLILLLLRKRRRDPRWVALYALSPIPVMEAVNNAHVDGLAVLLVLAALLALGTAPTPGEEPPGPPGRLGRRALWAGFLVGAAILVKLYPAALLVPLVGAPWLRMRQRVNLVLVALGTVAVGYLPHVLAVGVKVVGYLPGYLKAENYTGTGTRYLLVDLLRLRSSHEIDAVVALVVVATCVAILWRRPDPVLSCGLLFGVLLLVANPVQPWYSMVLLAVAAASPRPRWGLVGSAGYPYFFAVILGAEHRTGIGQISYGVALFGVVAAATAERLKGGGRSPDPTTAPGGTDPPADDSRDLVTSTPGGG